MSGGIAVLADEVGRRLGKKRLRLGKLRPKRVAQIGTAMAGVFVSLVTIVIVAVASSGVRQWIAEGRGAIVKLADTTKKLQEKQTELTQLTHDIEDTKRLNKNLRNSNGRLREQQQHLVTQLEKNRKEIQASQRQLLTLLHQVSGLRTQVLLASREIKRKQQALDRNRRQLADSQKRLAQTTGRLRQLRAELDRVTATKNEAVAQNSEAQAENMKLLDERQKLERSIGDLNGQIAQLQQDRDDADRELKNAQAELTSAQVDLTNTTEQLRTVNENLSNARAQAESWMLISNNSRHTPPTYLQGDEVSRLAVEPGLSMARAEAAVQTLLRNARLAALAAGAKPNGVYPEAGIFEHTDRLSGHTYTAEEIEHDLVLKLVSAKEPQVLVALSSFNAFKGEPVSLEVDCVPNPVVYHQNEVVAETKLDGRKDPSTIIGEISALGDKIRQRAMGDRMLPGATHELSASLSQDRIWRLVSDVKRSGGFVSIRALAESDIRAGDPLRVRFVVR